MSIRGPTEAEKRAEENILFLESVRRDKTNIPSKDAKFSVSNAYPGTPETKATTTPRGILKVTKSEPDLTKTTSARASSPGRTSAEPLTPTTPPPPPPGRASSPGRSLSASAKSFAPTTSLPIATPAPTKLPSPPPPLTRKTPPPPPKSPAKLATPLPSKGPASITPTKSSAKLILPKKATPKPVTFGAPPKSVAMLRPKTPAASSTVSRGLTPIGVGARRT